ncbi:hypothetical protein ANOBCDAF_04550 [Pleomorphomonas sp. T1.2MG-36]|nr:hypothetical protein ANOBCDAF_04550 [Pleomorphomonas sp. T1.2MG-36]
MAEEGDKNRNDQRLLRKTKFKGTDHLQYIWALQCDAPSVGMCTAPMVQTFICGVALSAMAAHLEYKGERHRATALPP